MTKWQATHRGYLVDSWWTVDEVDEDGRHVRVVVFCGDDETLAQRIGKLPELEADVQQLQTRLAEADDCIGEQYCGHGADGAAKVAAYYTKYDPDGDEAAGEEVTP